MSFHIYAWLENGKPRLRVEDADSKLTCMSWSYNDGNASSDADKHEIKRLFRELLLLTCKQEVANCRVFETLELKR